MRISGNSPCSSRLNTANHLPFQGNPRFSGGSEDDNTTSPEGKAKSKKSKASSVAKSVATSGKSVRSAISGVFTRFAEKLSLEKDPNKEIEKLNKKEMKKAAENAEVVTNEFRRLIVDEGESFDHVVKGMKLASEIADAEGTIPGYLILEAKIAKLATEFGVDWKPPSKQHSHDSIPSRLDLGSIPSSSSPGSTRRPSISSVQDKVGNRYEIGQMIRARKEGATLLDLDVAEEVERKKRAEGLKPLPANPKYKPLPPLPRESSSQWRASLLGEPIFQHGEPSTQQPPSSKYSSDSSINSSVYRAALNLHEPITPRE
jgi:hypothetical protein